uniref:Putative na+iodide/myo-inositol/multivitamin symporter n=1 Tax=Ixodes ricinus TaxID=34613 RepID=V5ICF2_IXORI
MSLMASFQSATTVLGYPAEMYYKGTQFWMAIFGLALSNVIAAELFMPVLYNLQLTSVNSYLERRFRSRAVRTLGSLSFIINTLLYMGVVLYGPSVALESVTGMPVWTSIVFLGLICTFYTVLGGLKAVVWTDAFQMIVMILGLASVVALGVIKVGGFRNVWSTAVQGDRIQFFNTKVDLHSSVSLWNVLLGTTFVWLASYGTSQTQVQRFCSVSTLKKAKTALYVNIPGVMMNISLGCLAGLVIYANYPDCDPLKSGKITKSDQLIPFFVMKTLSVVPGLPGLFVACVFSGALSTLSSGFNSLAAVTWEDFLVKWSNFTERQAAYVTKAVAAFYGFLTIGMAFHCWTSGLHSQGSILPCLGRFPVPYWEFSRWGCCCPSATERVPWRGCCSARPSASGWWWGRCSTSRGKRTCPRRWMPAPTSTSPKTLGAAPSLLHPRDFRICTTCRISSYPFWASWSHSSREYWSASSQGETLIKSKTQSYTRAVSHDDSLRPALQKTKKPKR